MDFSNSTLNPEDELEAKELRNKVELMTQELETYKQENHELQMKMNTLQLSESDAMQEVETLQELLVQEQKKHVEMVAQYEEEMLNCRATWRDRTENLEQQLEEQARKHKEEIDKLTNQLQELQNMSVSVADTTRQLEEMIQIKEKNAILIESLDELKEKTENYLLEINELNCKIKCVTQELSEEKEITENLRTELNSTREKLERSQEDLCLAKLQVEEYTAKGHAKKGNSLFSEVEDNRKLLIKKYEMFKSKYAYLKNQYNVKCSEVSRLWAAKTSFQQLYDNIVKDCKKFDEELVASYKTRIQDLEQSTKNKRQSVDNLSSGSDSKSLKWVDHLVHCKEKEIQELKNSLEEQSLARLMEAECLHSTRKELCMEKAKVVKLELDLQTAKCCSCKNQFVSQNVDNANDVTQRDPSCSSTNCNNNIKTNGNNNIAL